MPESPQQTVLFIVGPDIVDDNYADDYANAAAQLSALGYVAINPTLLDPGNVYPALTNCHGMATTARFDDNTAGRNVQLLEIGHALGKPELSVQGWARGTAPDAAAWFHELFDGAL